MYQRYTGIAALNVSLAVPRSWHAEIKGTQATFTTSGSSFPALIVRKESVEDLPFNFHTLAGSSATLHLTPLVISGKKAVRVVQDPAGSEAIHIEIPSTENVLTLSFPSPVLVDAALASKILQSLHLSAVHTSSPGKMSAQGSLPGTSSGPSAEGKPCGGPAGILCPGGYFCQVTDPAEDIGICKKLQ